MEDKTIIKSKCLKNVNSQKKRMMITPDVMLYTGNVMIPVVKPIPIKQSFNTPFSDGRPQIRKAQKYRNKPTLLFSKTPSHTLYNDLENLFEVKRTKHRKSKNQSTKYTISEKIPQIDSTNIEKANISRNSLPCKKKSNTLHFPNTTPTQLKPLMNDKEQLHKASSKSIQLSRKCNLSQIKGDQIKVDNEFIIMPKIEMPISDIMNKSKVISLPNESFHDIADTISTVSTLSVLSFNIENKKTFANIENREELISKTVSDHLHSNSEYEINVLHYDNDIPPKDKFPYFAQFNLNSSNTNWFSTERFDSAKPNNDNEHFDHKKNMEESYKLDIKELQAIRNIKYSWEAVNDWVPPSKKREYNNPNKINFKMYNEKSYDCEIKYSWQVIGMSTQTSHSLLQNLLDDNDIKANKSAYKLCNIKYSWQIIGMSTQASLHDCNDADYWSGILLTPNKNYNENSSQIGNNEINRAKSKYREGRLKRYLILNNQQTQTSFEKYVQADVNDYYAKYSWHNLIKRYL